MRRLRYLAPNLVTALSLSFAVLSVQSSLAGRTLDAAWFALYCVLTDKVDGFLARLLRASSEFGVQFDSLADLAAFGVAPAALFYGYLVKRSGLGFAQAGPAQLALGAAVVLYVLAVAFRLARFNVAAPATGTQIYFGLPTTLTGGTLLSLFVAMLKYGDPVATGLPATAFGGPRPLGGLALPAGSFLIWPALLALAALGMNSAIRVPKLGLPKSRAVAVFVLVNIAGVYVAGALRWLPEYLAAVGLLYMVVSIVYSMTFSTARAATRPPLFPDPAVAAVTASAPPSPPAAPTYQNLHR
jgi:CDP-diacylglycerol--serine O-phosphatidyltransferase